MGTKFGLASLAPLLIQLLYLQKFFVIRCLCMQRVENNKNFKSSDGTAKAFVTSAKRSRLYEKNLRNWAFSLNANKSISG